MPGKTITLGLMSGTSLDGIDVVACDFKNGIRLLGHHFVPYPENVKTSLTTLLRSGEDEIERLNDMGIVLAQLYSDATLALIDKINLSREKILAIGVHGQTVRHRPEKGWSLQINNPALISELTGLDVIADFRARDLAASGEGAPLVPAFHEAIFRSDVARAIVNIGGIANVTLLPEKGKRADVVGFDIGPGNTLLDAWCKNATGKDFDENGLLAAQGKVSEALLARFLSHPYFARRAPKSTGRETFNLAWVKENVENESVEDVQATLVALTAKTIAKSVLASPFAVKEVYLCGGGALNPVLVKTLEKELGGTSALDTTNALAIDPMHVEAMAFAWLTMAFFEKKAGNLPSATKALGRRILGALYPH